MDNMSPDISNTGYKDSDPSLTGREASEQFSGAGDTATRSNVGNNEASHTNLQDIDSQKSQSTQSSNKSVKEGRQSR